MPLSDDKWKVVLNRIRLSAMDKNVILPKENVEALRREFDKMLVDEPGGDAVVYKQDPKEFLDKYVTTSKEFKPRGKRRNIPFRRAAWNRVNKLISKYADEAGVRIVNAKPMKAAIGEDMKAFLDTNRVSGEGLDRVGESKVTDFIKGWFAGAGAKYRKKIPGKVEREAAREVKDEAAEKAAVEEVKAEAEKAAVRAQRLREQAKAKQEPLPEPDRHRHFRLKEAMDRQRREISGIFLEHVKSDDLIALKAASRAYQFVGADRGDATLLGNMVGQTSKYTEQPSIGGEWKVTYSDEFQTVWSDGQTLIVGYTGSDSYDDLIPNVKIATKAAGEFAPSAGIIQGAAKSASTLATLGGLSKLGKFAAALAQGSGLLKSATALLTSIESDPRILSVIKKTSEVIHSPENNGKRVLLTGHSLGAATAYLAYDKFKETAVSPTQFRVVGWELPWPMAADKPFNYIDGERRRAYVMPDDPFSDRLVIPGSSTFQKGTFIISPEGSETGSIMARHGIDALLANEEKVSQAHRAETAAVLSAEVEEEVAAVEEEQGDVKQEAPDVGETPEVKTDAASGLGEGGPDPGAEETVSTATGDRFRGVPGVGVPAAEPGSGTFGDVVRPELQAAVNANFHRYGKSFRQYIADFAASRRYSVMKAETGGDGHVGLDRLIANYGSEIGVAPFEHRDLDDASMKVLYAEVAAIVDWFLRNPERLPSRAINRLSVLLETKLFPAPEGTPVDQMTDDQLLAQMATRGAVVKVDPSTGRDRALAAVKDLLPGAGGAPSSVEAHPSGAATGDAAEAPGNVAGQPDEVDADGVVEIIDEDTFRLDTTRFLDTTGGTATRYDFALPMENGYSLSFVSEDDE